MKKKVPAVEKVFIFCGFQRQLAAVDPCFFHNLKDADLLLTAKTD